VSIAFPYAILVPPIIGGIVQTIRFQAVDEYSNEVAPRPYPATQAIPDWWKAMTPYTKTEDNPKGTKLIVRNFNSNASPKKCVPMLDAMTSGYIIPLWADVQVENVGPDKNITWRVSRNVFEQHGDMAREVQTPVGYNPQVFKFINKWNIITPKGYSCLIVSPLGHRQTGVQAVPAVIDTDKSTLEIVPPVWFSNDFEGILEKGTPMIQVIPFKRSDWKAEYTFLKDGQYKQIEDKNFNGTIINHYIKKVWQKKKYS
jgi:hypothetical protein